MLSALFVFAMSAVSSPAIASAAAASKVAVCTTSLRSGPSTGAGARAKLNGGSRVTVVASVAGGSYRANCGGKAVSGKYWYRITGVNGKSVRSLYGVSYVYAALGLFKAPPVTTVVRYAKCNSNLRTATTSSAASRAVVKANARVTVTASVKGSAWKTTCAGNTISGSTWLRITGVNGKSVWSLYHVKYLYAVTGLFAVTPPPPPTPPPDEAAVPPPAPPLPGTTNGIDVSHWQGPIDWTAVSGADKHFAYLKASEDIDYVDPTYTTNRAQAQAAGLHVGAYHFAQPGPEPGDATAEADHFVDTALPASGNLLPVLDLEHSNGLSQAALNAWVQEFMERVYVRLGVRAVIYCSPNFWKNYMGDTTWFADNGYEVLWVAHWTTATAPIVPGSAWNGKGWTFWQYTSDGSVPGITGRVDLDRFNGTDFTKVLIP